MNRDVSFPMSPHEYDSRRPYGGFHRHPERQRRISSRLRLTDKRSFAAAQDDGRRLPEYFDRPEHGNPAYFVSLT